MGEDIKLYAANETECRRQVLFREMDGYEPVDINIKCICCDVCAVKCDCGVWFNPFLFSSNNNFIDYYSINIIYIIQ